MALRLRTPAELTVHQAIEIALTVLFDSPRVDALEAYTVLKRFLPPPARQDHHPPPPAPLPVYRRCQLSECQAWLLSPHPCVRYCDRSCQQKAWRRRHPAYRNPKPRRPAPHANASN